MKLIDVQTEFFRPMWRRVAVVVVCFGWALFEFVYGDAFWGLLAGGIGAYCTREFFFAFNPTDTDAGTGTDAGADTGRDDP